MALLQFWASNRDGVLSQSIRQIVTNAGDGRLLDGSECSRELRQFLREVPSGYLFDYASQCLEGDFENKGFALQDIINELGRRLDFVVEDGRYHGVRNAVGFDGLWRKEGAADLIVEVKTTDRYAMSLDTFATYRTRLRAEQRVSEESSILLVVGRSDTGGLEAQVRGSRHAWDIRLISIDGLIKLVRLKEKSSDPSTTERIHDVLRPFEYTKVDRIIDLVFATAEDVEQGEDDSSPTPTVATEEADVGPTAEGEAEKPKRTQDRTPREELEQRRQMAVDGLGAHLGRALIRSTRTLYWTDDRSVRACVAVSKRYDIESQPYWYAFHPPWAEFLREAGSAFVVFATMDSAEAFAVPFAKFEPLLTKLNQTANDDRHYWHVALVPTQSGGLAINLSKVREHFDLEPFRFKLTALK